VVVTFDIGFCENIGCTRVDFMRCEKIFLSAMVMDIPVSEGVQKMGSQIPIPRND